MKLEENVGYLPEKAREILDNYKKEYEASAGVLSRMVNTVMEITVREILDEKSSVGQIIDKASELYESFYTVWHKVEDFKDMLDSQYEETRDEVIKKLYEEAIDTENNFYQLYRRASKLDDIVSSIDSFKLKHSD